MILLCKFCCNAGVWPAIVYTHWHRGEIERGQSLEYILKSSKNTIFNEHPVPSQLGPMIMLAIYYLTQMTGNHAIPTVERHVSQLNTLYETSFPKLTDQYFKVRMECPIFLYWLAHKSIIYWSDNYCGGPFRSVIHKFILDAFKLL